MEAPRTVRPRGGRLKFAEMEAELRASADKLPNWRLASVSRKMLADLALTLSEELPDGVVRLDNLDTLTARRCAAVQLATLMVRTTHAAITLIGSGYEPEAEIQLRRVLETTLRMQVILRDESGEHARRWLVGRAPGNIRSIAKRYGAQEELDLLSSFTHPTAQAVLQVSVFTADGSLDLFPARSGERAGRCLLIVAWESARIAQMLGMLFDVDMQLPRYVDIELARLYVTLTGLAERPPAAG